MRTLIFIIFMITFANDGYPAAVAGGDPLENAEKTIPSRLVQITAPDGTNHYLIGSHHGIPYSIYFANPKLTNQILKIKTLYTERDESDSAGKRFWERLLGLNKKTYDDSKDTESKHWLDVLVDYVEKNEPDSLKTSLKNFIAPREKVLRSLREDWGIACFTMLAMCGELEETCSPTSKSSEPDDIFKDFKVLDPIFERILQRYYEISERKVAHIETWESSFTDMFGGLNFITKQGGDFQSFLDTLKDGFNLSVPEEKDEGLSVFFQMDDGPKEDVFSPKTYSIEDYFDRGCKKRDITMANFIKEVLESGGGDSLFVAGADHVFGILESLNPWFDENEYKILFVRQAEEVPGYKFVKATLNEKGDTYEYTA